MQAYNIDKLTVLKGGQAEVSMSVANSLKAKIASFKLKSGFRRFIYNNINLVLKDKKLF